MSIKVNGSVNWKQWKWNNSYHSVNNDTWHAIKTFPLLCRHFEIVYSKRGVEISFEHIQYISCLLLLKYLINSIKWTLDYELFHFQMNSWISINLIENDLYAFIHIILNSTRVWTKLRESTNKLIEFNRYL